MVVTPSAGDFHCPLLTECRKIDFPRGQSDALKAVALFSSVIKEHLVSDKVSGSLGQGLSPSIFFFYIVVFPLFFGN